MKIAYTISLDKDGSVPYIMYAVSSFGKNSHQLKRAEGAGGNTMTEGHDEPRKTAFDTLTESIRSQEEQLDRIQTRISTAIAFKYHHRKFLESEEFWSHVQDFSFDCSGTIYITLIEGSDTAPLRLFAAETGIELSKGWSRYSGTMYAAGECPQTKQRVFITGYKTGRCQVKQVERVVPEHTEKEYELVCEGGAELADEP